MQFDVVGFIFNSLVLLFFTMTLGNLFGDIKFRKFNFGITGTLFIGLFVGYFLTKYAVTIPEGSKHISKAQNILNKTDLKLKKPVTITDNSNGVIRAFYSYYNANYNGNSNLDLLKETDAKLIEKSQQNAIIINPQKSSFSKTVYIEFEMN